MNNIVEIRQSNVASQMKSNPFLRIAEEELGSGQFLKFSKEGHWMTGRGDDEQSAPDGRYLALMNELHMGWVKWDTSGVVERRMVRVADGVKPPQREELGDNDESKWPLYADGRRNPWQYTYALPLIHEETSDKFLYSTSSWGGRRAVANLMKEHGHRQWQHEGDQPIIELGTETYQHKAYGKLRRPTLGVAGWLAGEAKPKPSLSSDMDEEIPF